MARYGDIDYGTYAKWGFLLGVALIAIGAGGEAIGHAFFEPLPEWEESLFLAAEAGGILVALLSPIVFGIVMPLTE